ncbi:MAG: hypothetical protein IJ092_06365 [Atopobiaceae bacterium]|nr:hypothetical protein [Atopobiaceae bacterium]
MSKRTDIIITALVIISLAGAIAMPALFAMGRAYGATCAGISACYALLLAWFVMEYARGRR